MKNKFLINYICEVNYPNSSAYGIHVLKMCDAFAEQKIRVNLFVPNLSIKIKKLKNDYKIKNSINFFKIFKKKNNLNILTRIYFSLIILNNQFINKKNYRNFFISRSVIFVLIGSLLKKNIIIELHHNLSGVTKYLFTIFKYLGILNNLKYIFIHKNLIKEFSPPEKNYICLDDAVDIRDFNTKKIKKFKKTCIYIGSFHPGKGVEKIYSIAKKMKNLNFHLYGDKKFLNKKKFPKNIKFFNYVTYKNIPSILSKYNIALMPYEKEVRGRLKNINLVNFMSPMKMFDYMASSKIILASDLKVYKHILKHKFNSILIKDNIEKWIFWINKIFNSEKKFKYLKVNAKNTSQKYTWKIRSKKILNFANMQFFK